MGCGASKDRARPDPGSVQMRGVEAGAKGTDPSKTDAVGAATSRAALQFEQHTPMLVMPLRKFKEQGRIMKSTKEWREKVLDRDLIVYEEGSGKIVIFISHTWWDREFKDETNDPKNVYDVGAPDYQTGEKKDLKWRIICDGVQRLIDKYGLAEDNVHLWIDWQSIYQDDEKKKLEGVESLIQYATLCEYMLVPTEEEKLSGLAAKFPEEIPGYGKRGWW